MEFYEQGKLFFAKAKEVKSVLLGTSLEFYLASADAFAEAHDVLTIKDAHISERAGLLAYHLYRHCSLNADKDSPVYIKAMNQLKTFSF